MKLWIFLFITFISNIIFVYLLSNQFIICENLLTSLLLTHLFTDMYFIFLIWSSPHVILLISNKLQHQYRQIITSISRTYLHLS